MASYLTNERGRRARRHYQTNSAGWLGGLRSIQWLLVGVSADGMPGKGQGGAVRRPKADDVGWRARRGEVAG